MRLVLILLGAALATSGQQLERHYISGNFPRDLYGPVDVRPNCYGHAEADYLTIDFDPPPGYHVRVLQLRGNTTAVPTLPDGGVLNGGSAGFLFGFNLSSADGSKYATWAADGFPLYLQGVISARKDADTVPYDFNVTEDNILPDGKLVLTLAAFLNTTGFALHVECTYGIRFEFVPDAIAPLPGLDAAAREVPEPASKRGLRLWFLRLLPLRGGLHLGDDRH